MTTAVPQQMIETMAKTIWVLNVQSSVTDEMLGSFESREKKKTEKQKKKNF